MIVKQYIKDFEKLGFGMFVHFGLYSVIGRGEWARLCLDIPREEYDKNLAKFKVKKTWARDLVRTAKNAGCKYITLTTRHHDGFSLYDTCGLNTYDAPHSAAGRDLVKEFVDECNKAGIVPFFYHTLIDWTYFFHDYSTPDPEAFKEYLKYLRASVEILCKNYGKIGGIWFDGMWANTQLDWEEDALYSLIRSYQPDAMIINNTGMGDRGNLGNMQLDSITFERGNPFRADFEAHGKYMASEMCEIFAEQWGYDRDNLNFKPLETILKELIYCRRYNANFLLNVGPKGDGSLDQMEMGYLDRIGTWVKHNDAAIRDITFVESNPNCADDFLVYNNTDKCWYFFVYNKPDSVEVSFDFAKKIRKMEYMDKITGVDFRQENGKVFFKSAQGGFGINLLVRVLKIKA